MFKCAVCGKGNSEGVDLYRVNVKGETGIWACKKHGIQAINNLAAERGEDVVLESNRRFICSDV